MTSRTGSTSTLSDIHRPTRSPARADGVSGAWTGDSVREVLDNPKHTGYIVWNRRKDPRPKRGVKGRVNPPSAWIWSSRPTHEPLITREIFNTASAVNRFRKSHAPARRPMCNPRPLAPTRCGPTCAVAHATGSVRHQEVVHLLPPPARRRRHRSRPATPGRSGSSLATSPASSAVATSADNAAKIGAADSTGIDNSVS
ncbi:recombinase family protein [Dactylosporangium sp. NPDC000555]|uniref:recombinase family protein n=1 Tax=Dactylosporangium sp. NPDC000555 TaxID=3154260 RepID=UPI00331DED52